MENCFFNHIAKDYHLKRKKPWKPFESFLLYLEKKGYIFKGLNIDLGCGNGRHFKLLNEKSFKLIGIDNSIEFLKIALEDLKNSDQYNNTEIDFIQIILADLRFLPIRLNLVQNIFSVAVIHHIRNKFERQGTIKQLYNILKDNGYILLTVWRKWQRTFRSYFFYDWFRRMISTTYKSKQQKEGLDEFGDKYVPWKISGEKKKYNRFYHFFSKREVKKLTEAFKTQEFKVLGGPNKQDNFFILAQKLK
ncbi:MAG: class I SAM-dependent methyltransferase [Candidatus Hodarchaeota archaeon]